MHADVGGRRLHLIAAIGRAFPVVLAFVLFLGALPSATVLAQTPEPTRVVDAFEVVGDTGDADADYIWSVSAGGEQWHLEASRPDDEDEVHLRLWDADGDQIGDARDPGGTALYDLALAPGDYLVRVYASDEGPGTFSLSASSEPTRYDPEPNDRTEDAVPLSEATEVVGRLAHGSDEDYYRLPVPASDGQLRDITLEAGEVERELCLFDPAGERVQCRDAAGAVSLPSLALTGGDYLIGVRGRDDATVPYRLAVSAPRPREADEEAEPNDDFATASGADAELGVEGWSTRYDPDFHRVRVSGPTQLWQVRASGPKVAELSLVRAGGVEVSRAEAAAEGSDVVIEDLVLVPGDHVFRVRAFDSRYRLELTPMGPQQPEQEREPNDDDVRAESFGIGERRVGRLPTADDVDHFRFSLAANDHVHLWLEQPAEADIDLTLYRNGADVVYRRGDEPGQRLDLDLELLPGDYLVRLRPQTPSDEAYALSSERLDPFELAVDQEPNDHAGAARPAPGSLVFVGDRASNGGSDEDWYALPALSSPATVTLTKVAGDPAAYLWMGPGAEERLTLEAVGDERYEAADVPADVPLYLQLRTRDPYEVHLAADGWDPSPAPPPSVVDVTVTLERDEVAAYWPEGQRLEGTIELANESATDTRVELETATSHAGWVLHPDVTEVDVPAGSSVTVPLTIEVAPDAWVSTPVRATVLARDAAGAARTGSVDLSAVADVPAAGSHLAWPVPDALLGGLNVAGQALGGETLGLVNAGREIYLFDDVTPAGAGLVTTVDSLPADFAVDLAGDAPIPVRGTIINPLAHGPQLPQVPRRFELLLSTDGETWAPALEGELSPRPVDQAFVLDEPVPATHAMLRVHETYAAGQRRIALGEWKVVAEPGAVPDDMPANIAAPVRGGHVALHRPYAGGWSDWAAMLDEDRRRDRARVEDGQDALEIVVGFQEGRAAQITGLRWTDPDSSAPDERVDEVVVAVSLDGPLGPWRDVGRWEFQRDEQGDGEVAPFDLPEPTWARYVRLFAALPPDRPRVEFPATVEVLERATDDSYRSILGEWGYTNDRGPYEWLVPAAVTSVVLDPDAGDTFATATPLALDDPYTDQATILEDEDWFAIDVPDTANQLEFTVAGIPSAGVRLSLVDDGGRTRDMVRRLEPGGAERFVADVEPGARYGLHVEQPPFNVVFTFDTSASMGPFLDYVMGGLREFAADVAPGREVANIVPVSQTALLRDWSDQPVLLEDAVNNFQPALGSDPSDIELGLIAASDMLAGREGVRAILAVGDGETHTLELAPEVWASLDRVKPVIYAVHVGASNKPEETRNLLRAWTDTNDGVYSYPTSHGEMGRAFERMSTRLRRPATYSLTAATEFVDRSPGLLSVFTPSGEPVGLAPDTGISIVLDTSSSMRKWLEGRRRIAIAKDSLRDVISNSIRQGTPVAIRSLGPGGKKWKCRSRLEVPLDPLDRAETLRWIKQLKVPKKAGTPLADALSKVPEDLSGIDNRIVVVITDGRESCGGDPLAEVGELEREGVSAVLNIVGFALDDDALRAEMTAWAELTGGRYFDATGGDELVAAIRSATGAPYDVLPPDGAAAVARGTVGGEPVEVPPGTFSVRVHSDPPVVLEDVVIAPGEAVSLELPASD